MIFKQDAARRIDELFEDLWALASEKHNRSMQEAEEDVDAVMKEFGYVREEK